MSSMYGAEKPICWARWSVRATPAITMSMAPLARSPGHSLPRDRHELEPHTEVARQGVGEVDIVPDELTVPLSIGNRQSVFAAAHADRAPGLDSIEGRVEVSRGGLEVVGVEHRHLRERGDQIHLRESLAAGVNIAPTSANSRFTSGICDIVIRMSGNAFCSCSLDVF